jgi:hypothetical protein
VSTAPRSTRLRTTTWRTKRKITYMHIGKLMMVDKPFEDALRSREPLAALRSVAMGFLSEGHEKEAILQRFENVRQALRQADRKREEDLVMEVMDQLVGWCSPHMKLPPDQTREIPAPPSAYTDRSRPA